MAVYALYDTGESAQRAVNALRATGIADADIAVISSEPMEDYEFSAINHRTLIWYIASAGGFVGLALGTWLTRMTEVAWPLPTGNMPIVAWWPNLIIMFELTMLGGILSAVATLIVTGGLARKVPALYDPDVTNGRILVGVESPRDGAAVERALRSVPGKYRTA
ncbi:MAG TPA: quinol:electron acceptor oxidoreductase subunit ActD [Vicinamibacterales bacterium]|nr:quinol:electron acceptor oxidoreductase subunit ActD [Vicinamibacterales bacterium]